MAFGNSFVTDVDGLLTSADVLEKAHLDFEVLQEPVFDGLGYTIGNYRNNYKSDDRRSLGIVSDKYKVVQNRDAFSFVDNLVDGKNTHYSRAGACNNWSTIWMQVALQPRNILGDDYNNYLFFKNSFDGGSAVKVCITPVRVVCKNTLNLALKKAKRTFSIRHTGDIAEKIKEADMTLELSANYLTTVEREYERLAKVKVTPQRIINIWDSLFPIEQDAPKTTKQNAERQRAALATAYDADDLGNFRGTAFGVVNAVSNFVNNAAPLRMTDSYFGNLFQKVTDGHPLLDKAYELVNAQVQ